MRGKIGIVTRGMTMIKILKRILNLIYKKISSKDKIQILGSVDDETLNLEVSDIGIQGKLWLVKFTQNQSDFISTSKTRTKSFLLANTKIKKNETKGILKSHKKRFIMVA